MRPPPRPPPWRRGRGAPPPPLVLPSPLPPASTCSAGEESEAEKKAVVAGGGSSAVLAPEPLHSSVRGFFFLNLAYSDVRNLGSGRGNCCLHLLHLLISQEEAGPVPGPLRRPWWVGLMAGRGLFRLLGPVQPGPGAALESSASAPAAPSRWRRWYRGSPPTRLPAAFSAVLGAVAKDPAVSLPTLATVYACAPPSALSPAFPARFHSPTRSRSVLGHRPAALPRKTFRGRHSPSCVCIFPDCRRGSGT